MLKTTNSTENGFTRDTVCKILVSECAFFDLHTKSVNRIMCLHKASIYCKIKI